MGGGDVLPAPIIREKVQVFFFRYIVRKYTEVLKYSWFANVVDGKTRCFQGQVYLAWVRSHDLTKDKFDRSQSQVGEIAL